VHGHRQDTRDRRLADSAMAAENITVRDAFLRDRILQGAGDVFLADDVGEFLRPVFAREDLVAHRRPRLYSFACVPLRAASFELGAAGHPVCSKPAARSSRPSNTKLATTRAPTTCADNLRGGVGRGTLLDRVLPR